MTGVRLVPDSLTTLQKVTRNFVVFIAEGEKDCNTLVSHGYVATCNPGGAEKWPSHFSQYFHDRNVVLLPDNDAGGRRHMRDVLLNLAPVANLVTTLALPGLPEKGDVSDYFKRADSRNLYSLLETSGLRGLLRSGRAR
jgi:DNA primase